MSAGKSAVLSIVITLIFGFLYFYFELPALNIHSGELYIFIILLCLVWCASSLILGGFRASSVKEYVGVARKKGRGALLYNLPLRARRRRRQRHRLEALPREGLRRAPAHRAGRLRQPTSRR